ncbi:hypothetical protein BH20ACT11_BH20ACT11_16530 [soil metagenome]
MYRGRDVERGKPMHRIHRGPVLGGARGVAIAILLLGSIWSLPGCSEDAGSDSGNGQDNGQQSQKSQEEGSGSEIGQPEESEDVGQEEQRNEDAAYASIGDEVSVGDVSYTVTDAERITQLEDPYGIDEPLTGNFMLVSFTFSNNGSEPVTVSDLGMYLYDDQGNQYETDSDAAFYLPDDTAMYMLDRVNPGLSQDVQTLYAVPPEANGFELEVSSGLFASETARIDLESGSQSAASGDPEEMEEEARQAVEDYYEAVNSDDWYYTYAHRDARARSAFTQEEWTLRNQWFEDTNPTTSTPVSVDLDESTLSSDQPIANVQRELTIDSTGYSEIRDATFVYEDGMWVVQYPEGGMPMYMPGATFEEFVRANGG